MINVQILHEFSTQYQERTVSGDNVSSIHIYFFAIIYFSLLTRESIGKEAELEMKLAIVSNALMKVCKKLTISYFSQMLKYRHTNPDIVFIRKGGGVGGGRERGVLVNGG